MTNPPDGERLRDSWNALAEDPSEASQVDHQAIWRAVAGEGTLDERLDLVDLVAHDAAAAESWRLAQALQRELQQELAKQESGWPMAWLGGRPGQVRFKRQQWAALAALLFLVVGFGLWRLVGPPSIGPQEPVFRQSSGSELLSLVPEDIPQPRDGLTLSWTDADAGAANSGTRYSVHLLRANLEPLLQLRELTASSVQIPAARLHEVAAGERLLWQVEAHRPDGQIITSPTFFLVLVPIAQSSTPSTNPQHEEP